MLDLEYEMVPDGYNSSGGATSTIEDGIPQLGQTWSHANLPRALSHNSLSPNYNPNTNYDTLQELIDNLPGNPRDPSRAGLAASPGANNSLQDAENEIRDGHLTSFNYTGSNPLIEEDLGENRKRAQQQRLYDDGPDDDKDGPDLLELLGLDDAEDRPNDPKNPNWRFHRYALIRGGRIAGEERKPGEEKKGEEGKKERDGATDERNPDLHAGEAGNDAEAARDLGRVARGAEGAKDAASALKEAADIGEGLKIGRDLLGAARFAALATVGTIAAAAAATLGTAAVITGVIALAGAAVGYGAFRFMNRSQDQSVAGALKTAYAATFNGEGEKHMQAGRAALRSEDLPDAAWQFTQAAGEATGITPTIRLVAHVVEHPKESAQAVGNAASFLARNSDRIENWGRLAAAHPGQALGVAAAGIVTGVEQGAGKAAQAALAEAKKNGLLQNAINDKHDLGLQGLGFGQFDLQPDAANDDELSPDRPDHRSDSIQRMRHVAASYASLMPAA